MLQWLPYVLVVSCLLSAAGWLAEQGMRRRKLPTRWAWMSAMTLIILFTYLSVPGLRSLRGMTTTPATHRTPLQTYWTNIQEVAPLTLPPVISPAATPAAYQATVQWNAVIVKLWWLLSALMIFAIGTNGVYVFWRRKTWPMQLIGSHCVCITPDIGPAVVGLLRPTIAIPRWVLDRPTAQQQLILAHEASHLQARDPLLLTSSLVVLILMPWNALLWWLCHRLRHAIEVDCDERVLGAGHDTQAYGEALIDVGERRGRFIGVVAAMSETRTLLERRVEIMAARTRKPSIYAFAALCIIATVVAAAATQIAAPANPDKGQQLAEALLRKAIATFGATGVPDYEDMTASVQAQIRRQLPDLTQGYQEYGPVQSVKFRGVTDTGADEFLVNHQNGKQSKWVIALNADGKVSEVAMQPSSPTVDSAEAEIDRLRYEQSRPQTVVPFDPKDFDKYVGYYQLGPVAFFHIFRTGDRYFVQLTGQQPVENFPKSPNEFFTTAVPAQISFEIGANAQVTGLVLHQNGRLQSAARVSDAVGIRAADELQERISSNTPSPGTEASLRRWIDAMENGEPNYSDMSASLADAARQQWPSTQQIVQRLGAFESLTFQRVSPTGWDVYGGTFANGRAEFNIAPLAPDGKASQRSWRVLP
jgi:hypothetical protein